MNILLDFLYPKNCFGCKKPGNYLCNDCRKKLKKSPQLCPICSFASPFGITHKKCQKPLGIDGIYAPFSYTDPLRKMIIKLKYNFASDLAKELSFALANNLKISKYPASEAIITPIPLHTKREKWRGFNQARELCGNTAGIMSWDYVPSILIRKINTTPQVGLERKKRKTNLKNAFEISDSFDPKGKQIIIFDDVCTTGATLKEAAKALKRRGATKVYGLAVAK